MFGNRFSYIREGLWGVAVFGDRFSYIREGRAMVFLRVAVFGDKLLH